MSSQPPNRVRLAERKSPAQSMRCANCGYGAVLTAQPPPCPMCRETAWEPDRWRPFRHLHDFWAGGGGNPPSAAG